MASVQGRKISTRRKTNDMNRQYGSGCFRWLEVVRTKGAKEERMYICEREKREREREREGRWRANNNEKEWKRERERGIRKDINCYISNSIFITLQSSFR